MVSSHASEPMVNQRGLPDPSPGNDCNDVDILVCPCVIQESDILLSTKNVASGNGQSGYGNLFRSRRARFTHRAPTLGIWQRNVRSAKNEGYELSQSRRWFTSY